MYTHLFLLCCRYVAEQMKEVGMVKVDQNTEVPLSTVVGKHIYYIIIVYYVLQYG